MLMTENEIKNKAIREHMTKKASIAQNIARGLEAVATLYTVCQDLHQEFEVLKAIDGLLADLTRFVLTIEKSD